MRIDINTYTINHAAGDDVDVFAIGDIHGRTDLFRALLDAAASIPRIDGRRRVIVQKARDGWRWGYKRGDGMRVHRERESMDGQDEGDEYDKTLAPLFERRDALVAEIEALGEEIREAIIRARKAAIHRAIVEDL